MSIVRNLLSLSALLPVALLAACTTLKPVDLAEESTPRPSAGAVWEDLGADDWDDWFGLLNEGPAALDWRLRAIDTATESIDIQTFLWFRDTVGSLLIDHLVAAADRGVEIKILVDDALLVNQDALLMALNDHPNIAYRIFNPNKQRSSQVAVRAALNLAEFHRVDHRMHNKALVIDNRVAIVGGRNIADEYFGLHEIANFRDLELLIGGPIVQEVADAFDRYWNNPWSVPIDQLTGVAPARVDVFEARRARAENTHLHKEEAPAERTRRWQDFVAATVDGSVELIVDTPIEEFGADEAPVELANRLAELLLTAREEIIIVSAYLIPTPRAETLIRELTERGVRVRILTNSIGSNNHISAHSAYRNHIGELIDSGAELHEVRTEAADRNLHMLTPVETKALALHAKALIIDDDHVFIGSPNLDPRSMRLNTEMGLMVNSEALNRQLRDALKPDFELSNAWHLQLNEDGRVIWVSDDMTLDAQPATSFMQRLEDWFFRQLPIENEL